MSLVPSKVTDRAGRSLPRPLQRSPDEALEQTPLGKSYLGLTSKDQQLQNVHLDALSCQQTGDDEGYVRKTGAM